MDVQNLDYHIHEFHNQMDISESSLSNHHSSVTHTDNNLNNSADKSVNDLSVSATVDNLNDSSRSAIETVPSSTVNEVDQASAIPI